VRIVIKADGGQVVKATTEMERIIAKAATQAMRDVGKLAINNGRDIMATAGFSSKFQKSLRVINRPASGYVLNPSEYVHSTINYSDIFETGKTITGSPFLWLPLPNVPPSADRAHMTPSQYVRQVGPLVTMRRPGHLPMLGAVVEQGGKPTRRRLRQTFLKGAFGEKRRATVTIPLFVGVPSVTIPKKFDLKGAWQDAFDHLDEFYAQRLEPYKDPNGN
jgi:hypothetical protein